MKYPKSLQDLIDSFMLYPGIGPKTAERFAFYTTIKLSKEQVKNFSDALIEASNKLKKCDVCGGLTDKDVCSICSDSNREKTIMVVESSKEINVFEKMNNFHGKYHVLNGLISPMNGINVEDININSLITRIDDEGIKKVIIATSGSTAGDITAMYIRNLLKDKQVEVFRIGYGLPVGGDIEYADEVTLLKALEGIKKI